MMEDNICIFTKPVTHYMLKQGFGISGGDVKLITKNHPELLVHGASLPVKIKIGGETFAVTLRNQAFDRQKFAGHADQIMLRYSDHSDFALRLQQLFPDVYKYFESESAKPENRRKRIPLPNGRHDSIRLYLTAEPGVFMLEPVTNHDYREMAETLKNVSEQDFESMGDKSFESCIDKSASIEQRQRLVKVRHLDRKIIEHIKQFYDYRDEVTGERIGEEYGHCVIEAHHLAPFTLSQNNNSSNIVVIAPNWHRIIHQNNASYNPQKFQFEFPNGARLPLKLHGHLG